MRHRAHDDVLAGLRVITNFLLDPGTKKEALEWVLTTERKSNYRVEQPISADDLTALKSQLGQLT